MDELDKDLETLRKKLTPEKLQEVRTNIVKLLVDECEKNRLSENQIYLYGFEIVRVLFQFYKDQVNKRYLIEPPKDWLLKNRDDKGFGG